ncbi:MAG: phosphatase PAP2 family protein [Planctomycetota bacterium]|nr:phosphatase PAP2 family protein [Planctomycetota bacterium]
MSSDASVPSFKPFAILSGFLAIASIRLFAWDQSVVGWIGNWHLPGDLRKAINLSEAFAHGFGAAAILGAILLVQGRSKRPIWTAICITLVSGLLANGLKATVVRIRPHQVGKIEVAQESKAQPAKPSGAVKFASHVEPSSDNHAEHIKDKPETVQATFWDARQRSFPSGHAATACGLAIGLSLLFPRGTLLFGMLSALACLQRLTSGAHFPSDVLAGASIAAACAALILWLQVRVQNRNVEASSVANSPVG